MSGYTPTTEHIESVYGRVSDAHGIPVQSEERRAEFRRWLAAHDAEVRAGFVPEEPGRGTAEALGFREAYREKR